MKAGKPLSLKARAIALLAQREHSRAELRRKLLRIAREQRAAQQRQAAAAAEPAAGLAAWFVPEPCSEAGVDALGQAENPDEDPDDGGDADVGAEVDALLLFLQERGYLSEQRFVDARIHARSARFGSQRIKLELAQHGLQLSGDQLALLKDSEIERARAVWQRKFGGQWPEDAATRAKHARFLIGRGFGGESVRRVLRGPVEADD
ncbi:regulatory protein RecX [Roseateles sp.]|uniref:regulatory protein RecX n=1 Tax=Roseateles sp. TaxID=1971397 RepID=UPI003D0DE15D